MTELSLVIRMSLLMSQSARRLLVGAVQGRILCSYVDLCTGPVGFAVKLAFPSLRMPAKQGNCCVLPHTSSVFNWGEAKKNVKEVLIMW